MSDVRGWARPVGPTFDVWRVIWGQGSLYGQGRLRGHAHLGPMHHVLGPSPDEQTDRHD